MKIGVNCDISKAEFVKLAGYDFIESKFNRLALMEQDEFKSVYDIIETIDFPVYAWNGYFKPDVRLFDGSLNLEHVKSYSELSLSRAAKLGGKVVVFGCGSCRKIPDGCDIDECEQRFCEILNISGDVAGKYGMEIAIEPLNYNETNFINTMVQGIDICKKVSNPNVTLLADFFHIFMNKEDEADVIKAGDLLAHVHIARRNTDRKAPTMQDAQDILYWSKILKNMGYDKTVSLECKFGDDVEQDIINARVVMDIFKND